MKTNNYVCNLCKRELTSDNYYVYAFDIISYLQTNKPPSVLFVAKECRKKVEAIMKGEAQCQLKQTNHH